MVAIELKGVTKNFGNVQALRGISLTFEKGKQYAIRGSSGSGKSTLLHLMGGLDKPTEGTILFRDEDIALFDDQRAARYRNLNVGFVFQFHFLLSSMTALENILLPAEIAGIPTGGVLDQTKRFAETLGVSHCLDKVPYKLSGGEQQRLNILRAVSLKPSLLLCDEPTGHLDSDNSRKVMALLKDLAFEIGSTLVVVTHDEETASGFHRQISIKDGRPT